MTKVIVFGAGHLFRQYIPLIKRRYEILGVCDNDPGKRGRSIEGYVCDAPDDLMALDDDAPVLICTGRAHATEIKEQLLGG